MFIISLERKFRILFQILYPVLGGIMIFYTDIIVSSTVLIVNISNLCYVYARFVLLYRFYVSLLAGCSNKMATIIDP